MQLFIKKFLLFSILFLSIVVNSYFFIFYNKTGEYVSRQTDEKLLLGRSILSSKLEEFKGVTYDAASYFLYNSTGIEQFEEILWYDGNGIVIGDAKGLIKEGGSVVQVDLAVIPGLLNGTGYLIAQSGGYKTIYFSILRPGTEGRSIVKLLTKISELSSESSQSVISDLFKMILIISVVLIFFFAYRSVGYIRKWKTTEKTGVSRDGQADLLFDTFHEILESRKEKERELNGLMKRAESRASALENYSDIILKSINTGVITFDMEGNIITLNVYAQQVLKLKDIYIQGRNYREVFGFDHPINFYIKAALEEDRYVSREEVEIVVRSRFVTLGTNTSALKDLHDGKVGVIFLFTDLTKIKRLQEKLETGKRLSLLGEMSGGIAHEFRNFMGTILGNARLLSKQLSDESPEQGLVTDIINELDSMERLISELLSLGKDASIKTEPVDVKEVILDVVKDIKSRQPQAPIFVNIQANPAKALLDRLLISRAVTNLVSNGLASLGNGGMVEVYVKTIPDPEKIYPEGLLVIDVKDNGEGISREVQKKIFLPFFTTRAKGTGLGLALTNKIALSHNGRLELKSTEGVGSTFSLILPISSKV